MTRASQRPVIVVAILLAAILVAACGGGDAEPITFGEGEIPGAFPDDFPTPPGVVIGSTLVDRVNHRSEFSMVTPTDMTAAIQFFLIELVNEGYVVESSEGASALWTIRFARGDLAGEVVLQPLGTAATQAVASINRS